MSYKVLKVCVANTIRLTKGMYLICCIGLSRQPPPGACTPLRVARGMRVISSFGLSRSTWDRMMKAADRFNIFWLAHVLPLYVVRFRLSPEEGLQLLVALKLSEWVDGPRSSVGIRELVRDVSPSFFQSVHQLGGVYMQGFDVPDLASIRTLYCARFGVDLSVAYGCAMDIAGTDCDETFMDWYCALTHVLATSLQLLCCARVRKSLQPMLSLYALTKTVALPTFQAMELTTLVTGQEAQVVLPLVGGQGP